MASTRRDDANYVGGTGRRLAACALGDVRAAPRALTDQVGQADAKHRHGAASVHAARSTRRALAKRSQVAGPIFATRSKCAPLDSGFCAA